MKRSALLSLIALPFARPTVRRPSIVGIGLVAAVSLLGVACAQDAPAPAEAADQGTPAASAEPTTAPSGAPAPLTSRSSQPAGAADGAEIKAPGAIFNLPGAWRSEPPSSTMRLAQAIIPGDAGEGQLTVFYFGPGGGGGVEANLDRWIGQMEATAAPQRDQFAVDGFTVTWVVVQGTLQPSTMGVGPTEPQPGSRLLGGIVEGPQGPWFFKATGPDATLAAAQDDFLAMLRSVRSPA
ncbi:MAG: hypothetical protein AAGC60_05745 [Acidobacteriota bacterium]